MGLFDKFMLKKDNYAYQVNDELETKGEFPERYIIRDRRSNAGNNSYILINKNYALDKKEIAEYEIQRYYRVVNR